MNPHSLPQPAIITHVEPMDRDDRVFTLQPKAPLEIRPGQFVELTIPGAGAFPVSTAGPATDGFTTCVRRIGRVTSALFRLDTGSSVGLRGPFGNGFDLTRFAGRDVLLIAGGLGIAPLRGLLIALLADRSSFGRLLLLYGARAAGNILFRHELEELADKQEIELRFSVDFATEMRETTNGYVCSIGLVTDLLDGLRLDPDGTTAAVCGPPSLYGCVLERLASLGLAPERIFATLERRMKCGTGHCCHCVCAGVPICQDGPVFSLAELRTMPGAI